MQLVHITVTLTYNNTILYVPTHTCACIHTQTTAAIHMCITDSTTTSICSGIFVILISTYHMIFSLFIRCLRACFYTYMCVCITMQNTCDCAVIALCIAVFRLLCACMPMYICLQYCTTRSLLLLLVQTLVTCMH
jgi:hypothetical protein